MQNKTHREVAKRGAADSCALTEGKTEILCFMLINRRRQTGLILPVSVCMSVYFGYVYSFSGSGYSTPNVSTVTVCIT